MDIFYQCVIFMCEIYVDLIIANTNEFVNIIFIKCVWQYMSIGF